MYADLPEVAGPPPRRPHKIPRPGGPGPPARPSRGAGGPGGRAKGGPSLTAQLAPADLIDDLSLTIAPCLLGGDSRRILTGPPVHMSRLALHTICEDDGSLFLRLRRAR